MTQGQIGADKYGAGSISCFRESGTAKLEWQKNGDFNNWSRLSAKRVSKLYLVVQIQGSQFNRGSLVYLDKRYGDFNCHLDKGHLLYSSFNVAH